MHHNTALLDMRMPAWAFGTVQRYRELARVPCTVNNATLYMAIMSNGILSQPDHTRVHAIRFALGIYPSSC
jgi:hypothetical protein